jgi:phosphoenolpyruvate-protein kinase (PTS system EI component)
VDDDYLRERAADMRDLTGRVLDNLLEVKDAFDLHHLTEPCILVSHDLSPSTTAQLDKKFVLGFATDIGGKTSHTAIMARSLDIPAVVGLQSISEELESGDYALLDGYNGTVIVNPTDQTLFEYGQLEKIKASLGEKLREILGSPPSRSTEKSSISPRTSRTSTTSRPSSRTARKASACSARNFCSSTAKACRTRKTNTKSIARSPPR